MEDKTRRDIRGMLKRFGVQADMAISEHLEGLPGTQDIHLKITLEDLTEYEGEGPAEPLHLVIEKDIRR